MITERVLAGLLPSALLIWASWITAGSLVQATNSDQEADRQTMENPFILVNTSIPGGFVSATLVKDAESYVEATSVMDKPEIGKYRGTIDRTLYEKCERELSEAGFTTLEKPQRLAPTVATITIGRGIGTDTSSIQFKTFPLRQTPEALTEFLKSSRKAIDLIRAHRFRVIEGHAECVQKKLNSRDNLEFRVRLLNVGVERTIISNPLSADNNLTRITVDLANLGNQSEEPKVLEFRQGEALLETNSKLSTSPEVQATKITLLPDDALTITLKKSAYIKPGTYQAAITVHFVEVEPNNVTQVTGRLRLETDKFTIESN